MTLLLMHGGASNVESDVFKRKQNAVSSALGKISDFSIDALDLVELAVEYMERDPHLNAGYGSILQLDGRARMDAGICTSDRKYAGILQIEQTKTPIKIARKLMDAAYHSILCGEGARKFADENGFPRENAITVEQMEAFEESCKTFPEISYQSFSRDMSDLNKKKLGTVGAVAIDKKGRMAAACSTGGTKYCFPGRVGDTAIYGAGVYCSEHVAVAMTGEGDKVLRRMTARLVEDLFLKSGNLHQAVTDAAQDLERHENGYCGIIAVSSDRQYAHAHNTAYMAFDQHAA